MSGFEDGFPYGSENEPPKPQPLPFDVEIERILIDLRSWDIERPDAVKAIKQAVEMHVIGDDEHFDQNDPRRRLTGEPFEWTERNSLRVEQRQSLWGKTS